MTFLEEFSAAITQSILTRFLANVFLFLVLGSGLVIGVYEIMHGQAVNDYAKSIVWAGVGYSLHLLGLNQGVTLQSIKKKDKETTQ